MKSRGNEGGPRAVVAWWIKCDPSSLRHQGWNWPDLFEEYEPGKPYLWSVGPSLSQKNARLARRGDPVIGYAAGEGHRELLALAEVERAGVFVPGEGPLRGASPFPGGFTVSIRPVALLPNPLPLAAIRVALRGLDPEFFRTRFGSIFKVRRAELARLLGAVKSANTGIRVPLAWRRRASTRARPDEARG